MVPPPPEDPIRVGRQDGVVTITLDRPERRNALTPSLFEALGAVFDAVAANPEDRVLVFTGTGGALCTGADLTGGGDEAQRLGTHDFREAMAAWMQKREGNYEGR